MSLDRGTPWLDSEDLATPPPAFADYIGWSRDRANRTALARFAAEITTRSTPPEQSDEHLLDVSEVWEAMLRGRAGRS